MPKARRTSSLSNKLRYILAKKYMDSDGSLSGEMMLNEDDSGYLEGILDSTDDKNVRQDVKTILEYLEADGTVILEIRH